MVVALFFCLHVNYQREIIHRGLGEVLLLAVEEISDVYRDKGRREVLWAVRSWEHGRWDDQGFEGGVLHRHVGYVQGVRRGVTRITNRLAFNLLEMSLIHCDEARHTSFELKTQVEVILSRGLYQLQWVFQKVNLIFDPRDLLCWLQELLWILKPLLLIPCIRVASSPGSLMHDTKPLAAVELADVACSVLSLILLQLHHSVLVLRLFIAHIININYYHFP